MGKEQSAKSNLFVIWVLPLPECKGECMKKILFLCALVALPMVLAGCAKRYEVEPIVEQNHKLIVPPNFGNMPK